MEFAWRTFEIVDADPFGEDEADTFEIVGTNMEAELESRAVFVE